MYECDMCIWANCAYQWSALTSYKWSVLNDVWVWYVHISEVRLQVKWAYKWSELTSEVRLQVKCAYKQSA